MNKKEFFSEISQLANFCDERLVESVYYGMVKVISRELRVQKRIKMPDWGEFYIHNAAPRQAVDVRSGQIRNLGMKKYVKFEPDYKVKAYFKNI